MVLLFVVIPAERSHMWMLNILRKRKKGVVGTVPTEMMKEFIGKVCSISLFNETFGITGKIVSLEDNWLKVEEKDTIRIVNGDMIRDIKLMPPKYQK